jgi:hypothetical protein
VITIAAGRPATQYAAGLGSSSTTAPVPGSARPVIRATSAWVLVRCRARWTRRPHRHSAITVARASMIASAATPAE